MAITIARAESARDISKVCELRYRIYIEELQIPTPEADHQWRWLRDPLEEYSISFAAWKDGEAIGSLRLTLLRDLPDPQPLLSRLSMHPAFGAFGSEAICTTSRFMLDPRMRNGRVIYPLMKAVYEHARDNGVRLNFGDCSPHQLRFYEHLGFRAYERGFADPAYGFKLPLLMLMGDRKEFEQRRTPLARVAAAYPCDEDARRWFGEIYAGEAPAVTGHSLGKGGVQQRLRKCLDDEPTRRCGLLRGISSEGLDTILNESTIFRVRAGDRVTRRGEPASAAFLLASGEASAEGAERRQTVWPGDHFGQTASFHSPTHSETVVAQAPSTVVAIPADLFGKLRRQKPELAARLDANLAKLPSARLDGRTRKAAASST
ncbi:MAG: GNAT family N-acetyltransferase [bacterium]